MIGIVDWRMEQCKKLDVKFYFNNYADKEIILKDLLSTTIRYFLNGLILFLPIWLRLTP